MAQLVTLQLYLDASPGGSDEDPDMAAYVSPRPLPRPCCLFVCTSRSRLKHV